MVVTVGAEAGLASDLEDAAVQSTVRVLELTGISPGGLHPMTVPLKYLGL